MEGDGEEIHLSSLSPLVRVRVKRKVRIIDEKVSKRYTFNIGTTFMTRVQRVQINESIG